MVEKIYETTLGDIHYWINTEAEHQECQLVFLPGLTANHHLFSDRTAAKKGLFTFSSGIEF